jgi:hypothetical protein
MLPQRGDFEDDFHVRIEKLRLLHCNEVRLRIEANAVCGGLQRATDGDNNNNNNNSNNNTNYLQRAAEGNQAAVHSTVRVGHKATQWHKPRALQDLQSNWQAARRLAERSVQYVCGQRWLHSLELGYELVYANIRDFSLLHRRDFDFELGCVVLALQLISHHTNKHKDMNR